ncbi:MAG: S-layer homology domain-containing protein, partial [Bacteroidales bacterium]|nr:S-layer homology domain-containing protein [Bacteroidales bacterium]
MRKRRILAWLMAMVMAIGLMPATALANPDEGTDLTYAAADVYQLDGGESQSKQDAPKYIWEKDDTVYVAFVTQQTKEFSKVRIGDQTLTEFDSENCAKGDSVTVGTKALTGKSSSECWQVVSFEGNLKNLVKDGEINIAWSTETGNGGHGSNGVDFTVKGWPTTPDPEETVLNFEVDKELEKVNGTKADVEEDDGNLYVEKDDDDEDDKDDKDDKDDIIIVKVGDKLTYEIELDNEGDALVGATVVVVDTKFKSNVAIDSVKVGGDSVDDYTDYTLDRENGTLTIRNVNLAADDQDDQDDDEDEIKIIYTLTVSENDVIELDNYGYRGKTGVVNTASVKDNTNSDKDKDDTEIVPVEKEEPNPEPDTYTVTYKYTGTAPADAPAVPVAKEYAKDETVTVADTPTLDGYTFDGWYKGNEKVTSFTMPAEKVTLTGSWTENASGPSISGLDKEVVKVNNDYVGLGKYKWEDGKLLEWKWDGFKSKWVEATLKEGDVVTYQITLENANDEALTDVDVTDSLFGKATNIKYSTYGKISGKYFDYYGEIVKDKSVEAENNTITIPAIPVGYRNKNGKCEITYSCEVNENSVTIPVTGGNYVLRNDVSAGGKTDSVEIPTNIVPDETTKYTVTFHYNYTGAPDKGIYTTAEVEENDTVTAPDDPTRDGEYTFLGWTTDPEGEVDYDFSEPVTDDLDLYAQWRAEVHRVEKVAVPTVYTDAGQKIQYFVLLENHNTEDIEVLVEDAKLNGAENIYYVTVDKLIAGRPVKVDSDNDGAITVPVPAQYESTVKTDIEKILDAIFGSLKPGKKTMDLDFDFDDLDLDWEDILSELGGFKGCDKLPDIKLPECGDQEIVIPGYTILTYTYTTTATDKGSNVVNTVKVGNKEDSATVEYKGITIPEIGDLEFHTMFKKAIENKVNDTLDGNYTVDNEPFNLGVDKINVKAGSTTAKGIVTNYYNGALDNDHWWTENLNDKIDDATKVDGLEIKVLTGWEDDGLFKQFVYQTVAVDKDHIRLAHFPEKTVPFTEIYLGFDVTFKAKDENGGWQIVQCNEKNTNVVFFDSKDGGTITPPKVEGEDVTWYTDEACTQEWNGKIVRNTTLYTGKPDTPPEEETSAIVRFYAYDAGITDAQPNVKDKVDDVTLTVDAGYAFLDESVKVEGLEPGTGSGWTEVAADNTASVEWMTNNKVTPASDVTVAEVFTALSGRGASLDGTADDYKLELKNIGWESTDEAYHVHYVLVKNDVPDKEEADLDIKKELVKVDGKDYNGKKVSKGDELTYYITVDNFAGDKTADNIVVKENPKNLKNGKFIGVLDEDEELVKFEKAENYKIQIDYIVIEREDDDTVTIDELEPGDEIVLVYEGTVSSSGKDVVNKVTAEEDGGSYASDELTTAVKDSGGIPSKNRPTKVEEVLNTEDHFQYVQGYPDNTVGPERNITRAEATVIFFRLLNDSVRAEYLDADNAFPDVNLNDWFNLGVSTMENGGFVSGYDDGLFRPNAYITRAELATIISNFDDLEPAAENKFADVEGHWAEKYINSAAEKGWLSGYEDGLFRPNQYITRAETMSMINRVLDRRVDADGLHAAAKQWKDNPESKWYYYAVL